MNIKNVIIGGVMLLLPGCVGYVPVAGPSYGYSRAPIVTYTPRAYVAPVYPQYYGNSGYYPHRTPYNRHYNGNYRFHYRRTW